jgi:hypothetical protein
VGKLMGGTAEPGLSQVEADTQELAHLRRGKGTSGRLDEAKQGMLSAPQQRHQLNRWCYRVGLDDELRKISVAYLHPN